MSRCLTLATALLMLAGCASPPTTGCVTRTDCAEAELCVNGMCQPSNHDAGVDQDANTGGDTNAGLCGQECETDLPCEIGVYDCSGDLPVCVRSGLHERGYVCRDAVDSCDQDDICDGVSAGCADGKTDIGTPCDGGFCDGRGACGACQQGIPCEPEACQTGTIACSQAGVPSCEATGNLPDDTSCGDIVIGGYSACEWDDDECAESGERSREIQEALCRAGACTVHSRMESMPCSRDREGSSCGDTTMSEWSACSYESPCDESASRSRTITDHQCQSSSCVDIPRNESEDCTRDTDGMSCGETTPGRISECVFSSECAISGTRTREENLLICADASCETMRVSVPEGCTRDNTMGDPCGTPTYGAWSACTSLTCDPSGGSRFRSVTSACTAAQTCDPSGSGFELGSCTDIVGSSCNNPPGGGFGTCVGPNECCSGACP